MKKLLLSLPSMAAKCFFAFAFWALLSSSLQAGTVEFFLDLCRFQAVNGNPYVEVYMSIDGTSVAYKKAENGYQSNVNILVRTYKISDGDSVINYQDRFNLLSQIIADTSLASRKQAFVELKRIQMQPGNYLLEVIMEDNHDSTGIAVGNYYDFEIEEPSKEFSFSDLEFIHSIEKAQSENIFTKNGFQIIPFGMNASFIEQEKLAFYLEMYNTDLAFTGDFFAEATILQGGRPLFMYNLMRQKQPNQINVFSGDFDISKLPSQTYQLQIKLFSKMNPEGEKLVKTFYVANSKVAPKLAEYTAQKTGSDLFSDYSDEQLTYYLRTLIHISTENEIRFAKALTEKADKQNYLFSFWQKRMSQNKTVEKLWRGHLAALDYINNQFKSNFREGWQTDRGRVFLKYGIPSDIELFPYESNKKPHEIWKYDRLGAQAQIIFVFMDNDLGSGEYLLIHSNKYGEIQNFGWEGMLVTGDTAYPNQEFQRDTYEGSRQLRDIDP